MGMAEAYVIIKLAKGTQRVSNVLPTATADQVGALVNAISPFKKPAYASATIVIESPLTV